MFRPARQCLSRWTLSLILVGLATFGAVWLLFVHDKSTDALNCGSSKQCYEAFMSAARRVGQNALPDKALWMPSRLTSADESSSPRESALPPAESSKKDEVAVVATPPPQDSEYARLTDTSQGRVKAAFVVLARNKEIYALRSSMRYLEDRFNHKYNYPWIFLNEEPFTEEFKNMSRQMTNAETYFGLVPTEHWSYPDHINQTYAQECREHMRAMGIPYGGSESYRHMCRYQSGFFMLHPLLDGLDYYWRVEPGVKFSCDIEYDPFRLMQERDLKYGFTIALGEYRATVETLWDSTLEFVKAHPQYIYPRTRPDSLLNWITDDNGWSYNLCHFWSNFEIASVKFMRSEGYQAYFRHLDQAGGFFYERWGDAPVHSIAVALMLGAKDVHWFYDIGYKHDFFEHCPTGPSWLTLGKCYCDPNTSFDFTGGSCIPKYLSVTNHTTTDFLVVQPEEGDEE